MLCLDVVAQNVGRSVEHHHGYLDRAAFGRDRPPGDFEDWPAARQSERFPLGGQRHPGGDVLPEPGRAWPSSASRAYVPPGPVSGSAIRVPAAMDAGSQDVANLHRAAVDQIAAAPHHDRPGTERGRGQGRLPLLGDLDPVNLASAVLASAAWIPGPLSH